MISMRVNTKFLGKCNFHYDIIDSTQSEVWRLYKENKPNGTLVVADIQTKGQGTHGRTWHTDEKGDIAFSFFIKPNCNIHKLDGLTVKIAEIIVKVFENKYGISLYIKKPNDIVFNGKKLGGILTETKVEKEKVKAIAVGIRDKYE